MATKYRVDWDNGQVDLITMRGAEPAACAEEGRRLINNWAKVGIYGTLVQIEETPVYRHPEAPDVFN